MLGGRGRHQPAVLPSVQYSLFIIGCPFVSEKDSINGTFLLTSNTVIMYLFNIQC